MGRGRTYTFEYKYIYIHLYVDCILYMHILLNNTWGPALNPLTVGK